MPVRVGSLPQAWSSPPGRVLLLTLALRLTYSLIGVSLAPTLALDPALIEMNQLTDNLMPQSEGLRYGVLGIWERFDTLWYLRIAEHGYDLPQASVFYPLYPSLIRALSAIGIGGLASALIVSTMATFFLLLGLFRLAEMDLPAGAAWRSVLLLAAWPASFIFLAGYPDSLVLALVVWAVYWARTDRWGLAIKVAPPES